MIRGWPVPILCVVTIALNACAAAKSETDESHDLRKRYDLSKSRDSSEPYDLFYSPNLPEAYDAHDAYDLFEAYELHDVVDLPESSEANDVVDLPELSEAHEVVDLSERSEAHDLSDQSDLSWPYDLSDQSHPPACLESCDDGKECTFDLCVGGVCVNEMKPGWCFLGGKCVKEGEVNPNNPCLECISSYKIYTWSADDTNACDDGDPCTEEDFCQDGQCLGKGVGCDDGNPCTQEFCVDGECVFLPWDGVACEDGNLCTLGDTCLSAACAPGEILRECDDFNPCTVDVCDPTFGCIYTPVVLPCEDGDMCTENDVCFQGVCQPGEPVVCDDGNECTTDSCSPFMGCKFINNSLPCEDADPCTIGDQCVGGKCKSGKDSLDCNDNNSCTAEQCKPFVGCLYFPISGACNDGDACTFGDHCQDGECVYKWKMECSDSNPCTDDVCDPAFGCAHIYNSNECDDGNACTIGDQCVKGECKAGPIYLDCFAGNPCATGYCDPAVGCVMIPLDGEQCDDGNICTGNDFCKGGECQPGEEEVLDCSDGNPCTADWCDPKLGCLHKNSEALCDDLNLCTDNDSCVDGVCVGIPVSCDDGNQCSVDWCDELEGCLHSVIVSPYCQPQIVIEYPPRAVELIAPPSTIQVSGHVIHNAAPVASFTINGTEVALDKKDKFSFTLQGVQGLNVIEAEVFDLYDGHDKVVQTFLLSTAYTPMNAANPAASMIKDGLMIFLGQNVWDDDNPDPNDFAALFTYFFNSLDIASMIPDPLYENDQYKVKGEGLSHGPFSLDITCIYGGLLMIAEVPNLHLHLNADSKQWYLPDASGNVDADKLVVSMDVMLSVDDMGNVNADLKNVEAEVQGLDVSLDGLLGFLLNWLVDFFEDELASMLEDQIEAKLKSELLPVLEGALEDLAFDSEFELPPLFGNKEPVKLSLKSLISTLDFSPTGGVVGLKAAVVTPKGTKLDSLGSIHRGMCLGQEAPFKFWMLDEIEMGIMDDFLNQIPYAMWWAGMLSISLDSAALGGGSFEEYGIDDLSLTATLLLPPVITDCPGGEMQLQIGDMEINASFVMFGMPVDVTMYATFTARISIKVEQKNGQNALSMGVTKIEDVKLEVATVSENLVGSEDSLRMLIKEHVLPMFLEQITGDALASIPLPEMDMSGMIPGAPAEAKLKMTPMSQYRQGGYTVITGTVHE